jgi:TetR/AcrR family transcriptional repressor of uid operon
MAPRAPNAPSQREKQRAATRERLLQAALAEFRRVGFGNAQIDAIVSEAGVVRGTFYHHFPSKDHVLLETSRRFSEDLAAGIMSLRGTNPSLRVVLGHVVEGILDLDAQMGESDLMRELLALYLRAPLDSEDEFEDGGSPLGDELEAHFREAAERGELRRDLDPDQAAMILLTSIFGLLTTRKERDDQLRKGLESLMDIFLKGMSP